jgi:hypothetical protein
LRRRSAAGRNGQKINFSEMRDTGGRGILVYGADDYCSHSIAMIADKWSDHDRLSDLEPRFVCEACEKKRRCEAKVSLEQAAGRGDGLSVVFLLADRRAKKRREDEIFKTTIYRGGILRSGHAVPRSDGHRLEAR